MRKVTPDIKIKTGDMKIYIGKSKKEIELLPYPAVNKNDVYIEALEGGKTITGITMPKTDWENRMEALENIKKELESRLSKDEMVFQPKNYEEFVDFCEQECISTASWEAKQKLKEFSSEIESFFD